MTGLVLVAGAALMASPALVAALPAPITNVNINSLVPVPLAYDNVWLALWSLVTVNCGVPVTSTASLNLAVTDNVPPSDLSNAVILKSILVMSATPSLVAKPLSATSTSGVALVLSFPDRIEPASL